MPAPRLRPVPRRLDRRLDRIGTVKAGPFKLGSERATLRKFAGRFGYYFRFPPSFREVEELMLQRGVVVSYETIRRWCAKFGQA